jgi:hypothetical protein
MQTFLPYPDFKQSALCLDYRRLGKQRVETKQIFLAIENPSYGWQNHPAVNMWRGYEGALAQYGSDICMEWIVNRGHSDTLLTFFYRRKQKYPYNPPAWLGSHEFHASHRANLLRKDPKYYGKFGWTEDINLPYVWPKGILAR